MGMSAYKSYKRRQLKEQIEEISKESVERNVQQVKDMCDKYIDGYIEHAELVLYLVLMESGITPRKLEKIVKTYKERYFEMKSLYVQDDTDWGKDPDNPYKGSAQSDAAKKKLHDLGFDYDAVLDRIMENG